MQQTPKILPPIWLVLGMVLTVGLDRYLPLFEPGWPWLRPTGRVVAAIGLLMIVWPAIQFLLARTGLVPFTEATSLVTSGFYRVTRNPMYLGMALMLLGFALTQGSLGAVLPAPLFVWIIQNRFIKGEERFLEAAFGAEYRAYCERVRRWL